MSRMAGVQGLWRRAVPSGLRSAAAPLVTRAIETYVRATPRPPRALEGAGLPVKVVGLEGAHGVAASARLAARAFETLGTPVETVTLHGDTRDWARRLGAPERAAWMFHLNPPELLAALAHLGPRRVAGPRFGYWAWELPRAPRSWLADARLVDEVLAPSRYVAEALAGARAPVRVTPHPLFLEDYAGVRPAKRQARFQAVALFDFNSSAARKNPQGALKAFDLAFGQDRRAELVLKSQNGAAFPKLMAELQALAGPNVRIVDETWPYDQVKALIAGADALISLHRAEGFGLPVAEAMALGTPVVTTAHSGVLDFADADSALLIPWRPTPVVDPQGLYAGQSWAEPDLRAAAEALVRLRDEAHLRVHLAEAGRRAVDQKLSPAAWFRSLPQALQAAALSAR